MSSRLAAVQPAGSSEIVILAASTNAARWKKGGKLLRKLHFYTAVVVLQCFAAFPVHANAPLDLTWDSQTRTYLTNSQVYVTVPKQSVWMYVPPAYYLAKDEALVEAFNRTGFPPGTCDATNYFFGWQL